MGFMDTVKGLVGGHKDQSKQAVDEGAKLAEEKIGGAHADQIKSGVEKVDEAIDKLPDQS